MRANPEILILEDDAETLDRLRDHFTRKRFHPLASRSASRAITMLQNNLQSSRPVLAIVDSHVVGIAKPAAEIFRHALEPLGVPPEQAIYVGDTVRYDVRGARAAGLRPVHFDPFDLCPDRTDHAHIHRLTDL